jgi:hypothetical protein
MTIMLEKPEVKLKKTDDEIISLLFKKIQRPKKYTKIKVVNVYGNSYRINIWCEFRDQFNNIDRTKICQSYFCKLKDEELIIIS